MTIWKEWREDQRLRAFLGLPTVGGVLQSVVGFAIVGGTIAYALYAVYRHAAN